MPRLTKLTPNLIVADVERSIAFYRDVLGFTVSTTVPEAAPYVFAILTSGDIEVFVNAAAAAYAEYPALESLPIGGTFTMFIETDDVATLHDGLKDRVPIAMPLERKWYGLTEFAITDPDGYTITFAQRH